MRLVVKMRSNQPSEKARSTFSSPPVKRPKVENRNTRRAPISLSCRAVSRMLPPEAIMSSTTITSFPLTDPPQKSCATTGFVPFMMCV